MNRLWPGWVLFWYPLVSVKTFHFTFSMKTPCKMCIKQIFMFYFELSVVVWESWSNKFGNQP